MAAVVSRTQPRLVAFYGIIGLAFLALAGQLWNLQVAQGGEYRQRAEVNRVRVVTERPLRGVIYDRAGRQVARNVPSWTVGVRPADLPRDSKARADLYQRLGRALAVDPEKIAGIVDAARDDPFTPTRVKAAVTRDLALTIEEQQGQFPGVVVTFTPVRAYPQGPLLGQILGYTGPIPEAVLPSRLSQGYERDDTLGLSGIEATFEDELKGSAGKKQVEVDALGRVTNELATLVPTVTGGNVVLTLDTALQQKGTELLGAALIKAKSSQGALVALDPRNGDVLAMVSLPQYDNNLFAEGISTTEYQRLTEDPAHPMLNQAIGGLYPPGSTFKLVTASAALQEKIVTPQQQIPCPGAMTVSNQVFRNWNPLGQGNVNARQAIAVSCDPYFYVVSGGNPNTGFKGMGIQKLAEYARQFGFGERTGIRLPGEERGLVPTDDWKRETKKEQWFIGDNYNVGIGQGDLQVSPLQLANMTAAIANGGTLYRPRLVSGVRTAEGQTVQSYAPEAIRKIPVSQDVLNIVRAGMRDAVASPDGTAYYALKQPSLTIAGKTGTAEYFGPRDSHGNLPTHALFVGYAPYEDPQIAVAVVVYGGGEGSEIAAPVAADVMKAYFELGVH